MHTYIHTYPFAEEGYIPYLDYKTDELYSYADECGSIELLLPLLANVGALFFPSSTSSLCVGSESCWIKGGQLDAGRRPVPHQFAHGLSARRRPGNSPAVMSTIAVGPYVTGDSSHVRHGIRSTRPHACLDSVQLTLVLVYGRHGLEGLFGSIHSSRIGITNLPKGAFLEIFR